MRFSFSRRNMLTGAAATGLASTEGIANYAREAGNAAGDPIMSTQNSLLHRLATSAGATLMGYARRDGRAAGTVQKKLQEFASIADFGAIAEAGIDNTAAIQQAIDVLHKGGGGTLLIPTGVFNFSRTLRLRPNVRLQGLGATSVLHFTSRLRDSAVHVAGSAAAPSMGIGLCNLMIQGDARFSGGVPDIINGNGVLLEYVDGCEVTCITVQGFSDGGIVILNGNTNSIANCRVDSTAQGICFIANDISVTGNVAIGNRITNTGEYNGLHLEGGFGGKSRGEVRHTTVCGNHIDHSWEAGINIELAPYTSCVGNTVRRSGIGRTSINMGLKLYGGYRSAICGNTIADSSGHAIVVGANSGECVVAGNTTAENGGSLLLTDSGAQVSNDVAIGVNAFTEGDPQASGNVRIRTRLPNLSLANRPDPDPRVLDWYEEGEFNAAVRQGLKATDARYSVRYARYTRIGNLVHLSLRLDWSGRHPDEEIQILDLPYAGSGATYLTAVCETAGRSATAVWARINDGEKSIAVERREANEIAGMPAAGSGSLLISGHYMVSD